MYALQQDMVDRFGAAELALYAGDGSGGIDGIRVGRALNDAASVIDRHLAGRYRLPLTTLDAGLTRIACDLARFSLRGDETDPNHLVAVNAKTALQQLGDLARGITELQAAGSALPPAASTGIAAIPGAPAFAAARQW